MNENQLDALPADVSQEKTLSIIQLILDGGVGGQIIMAILFVLLIIAVYIYVERFLAIKSAGKIDKDFMNQIKEQVSIGNIDGAKSLSAKYDTPVANLIGKGVSRIGKPLEDINTAIENAGKLEIYKLEKNVSILATISGAAPMIGFLGTVLGMIVSIHEIANSGGQIDIKMLSDGLYTAMTTTVGGLIVGIISYITYNDIVVKTDKVIYQMEAKSFEFLDLLDEPI
ncbi:MotA/TolQ/ExbB proton channel family protein [Wenyingzhuangia sp. IMCC45574]